MTERIESGRFYTETLVTKYPGEAESYLRNKLGREPLAADYESYRITPDEELEGPQPGNVLLTVGINQLWRRCATSDTLWDATHGAIGVGDSSTAHVSSQSALQAASNKYYRVLDSTPTVGASGGTTTTAIFIATFGTSVGNFAWNEYGVLIPETSAAVYTSGTTQQSDYTLLNRKAGAGLLGTKTGSQTWVFTVTMTLT